MGLDTTGLGVMIWERVVQSTKRKVQDKKG